MEFVLWTFYHPDIGFEVHREIRSFPVRITDSVFIVWDRPWPIREGYLLW